jgi:hypothetical protein
MKACPEVRMQLDHHAASPRPTAEWISRYAAELLASAPGMHPLDAVRQAIEATAGAADEGHPRVPPGAAPQPAPGRGSRSA